VPTANPVRSTLEPVKAPDVSSSVQVPPASLPVSNVNRSRGEFAATSLSQTLKGVAVPASEASSIVIVILSESLQVPLSIVYVNV